jgi:hypothetical protein
VVSIVKILIDVGGRELVMFLGNITALHSACQSSNPAAVDIVKILIDSGGRELVMMRTIYHVTTLHYVCRLSNPTAALIAKILIDEGGRELVVSRNRHDETALRIACRVSDPLAVDIIRVLVERGIKLNIRGEFGIGGIFNNRQYDQQWIYKTWNGKIAPALSHETMQVLLANKPILHAAIMDKAPIHVIQDIITMFPNSVGFQDCYKRSPLMLAMEEGLQWMNGLNLIVEMTAIQQRCTMLDVATKNGLPWDYGIQYTVRDENVDDVGCMDNKTGFYPFMAAAIMDIENEMKECDLESIFNLMKMRPDLVRQ